MSIKNPDNQDMHIAALTGMDSRIDTEVAEDLGIPSSPEAFASHGESGRQVASILEANNAVAEVVYPALTPATDNPKRFEFGAWRTVSQQQRETNMRGVALIRQTLAERSKR